MINIKTDSRKIKPGDIFVALRGYSSDGHTYIENAISNGASKLIVEEDRNYKIPYEVVLNTRDYVTKYLIDNYKKYLDEMTIIGITGTNGKTTSAYLIYTALNKLGKNCAYIGTIGYYLKEGLEYALANTSPDICDLYELLIDAYDRGYRYVSLEASSQGLHRKWLSGIPFSYAVFTNLTRDHLDYHNTMDEYAKAKAILFNQLKQNTGIGIVNYDDSYKNYFICEKLKTYGIKGGDYKASDIEYSNHGTKYKCSISNEILEIDSHLLGKYNIYNMLVAISILDNLGYKKNDIEYVIKDLKCPPGRMDIIVHESNSIIIDYAHTEDAIENILNTVKAICKGNIYVVFGCTGNRDTVKRPMMTNLILNNTEYAIITNDDPHDEEPEDIVKDMLLGINNKNYEIILDRGQAIQKGINLLKDNDILLILGKGHEEYMIIKDKKIPFNDKKKVEEILNK